MSDAEYNSEDRFDNAVHFLREWLFQDAWNPQEVGEGVFRFLYEDGGTQGVGYAHIFKGLEQLVVYAIVLKHTPKEFYPQVVEYITRANYGLRLGAFEFDYDDGEVRFRNGLDFESEVLTADNIRNLAYPALSTVAKYSAGLRKVANGQAPPSEAIAASEVDD